MTKCQGCEGAIKRISGIVTGVSLAGVKNETKRLAEKSK